MNETSLINFYTSLPRKSLEQLWTESPVVYKNDLCLIYFSRVPWKHVHAFLVGNFLQKRFFNIKIFKEYHAFR